MAIGLHPLALIVYATLEAAVNASAARLTGDCRGAYQRARQPGANAAAANTESDEWLRCPHDSMANAIRFLSVGRRREGQKRPSRPADGRGRHRDGAVPRRAEIRRRRPALARPRPLRAVGRPWLDAALFAALSDRGRRRRRADDRRSAGVPPARLEDARPSRIRPHDRRRDDDRPARAGASPPRSAWRSPSGCWPPNSATSSTTTPMSSPPTAT